MASRVRFPAMPAIAENRLIRQGSRQIFQCSYSLRMNRPELDAISFSLYRGHIDRLGKSIFINRLSHDRSVKQKLFCLLRSDTPEQPTI